MVMTGDMRAVLLVMCRHLLGKRRPLGGKGCLLAGKACNRRTDITLSRCGTYKRHSKDAKLL